MKKSWVVAAALALVLILGILVFVMLPGVSNAPTMHGPGASAGGSAATIADTIVVDVPLPQSKITSPLTISGKARGPWYFEASAPVVLKDSSGTVIAHGTIRAQGSWMTNEYVPFSGTLTFSAPSTPTGTLVLQNDNPSGDPKKLKTLEIPVIF